MKTPLRKRFGLTVKTIRLASGVSQEAFADRCGFARSYMSRIERGVANPSLDAIDALAVALKVEVAVLFPASTAGVKTSAALPVTVPFAADGSCFNPSLRRTRTGRYTVGKKAHEVAFGTFDAAVGHLRSMDTAYWRRPNRAGNWSLVVAVRWGPLPAKYLVF